MYVIAGVSGRTGAVVADTLLAAGKRVRVIVRTAARGEPWRTRGAEVAVASLADAAALGAALEGATASYLLSPQDPASSDPVSDGWRIADAIARAIDRSRVPHVVFLSTMGADRTDDIGIARTLHAAEARLAEAPAAITFVRPAHFLQNWALVLHAAADGKLPTFIRPDRTLPMASTRDIGLLAARALLEGTPAARRTILDIVGPRDYSPNDLAAVLARLLGRPVTAEHAPLDAVVPTFTRFGASAAFAEQVRRLYQAIEHQGLGAAADRDARVVRGEEDAARVFTALLNARTQP